MPEVDFERHNAEVKAVWEAYRAHRTLRVPVILGVNTRFFLLGEKAPFPHVSFKEYTENPDVMFDTQVRFQDWARHHLVQDAPMGLPSEEEGWTVNVDFQNFYEAGWFGCEIAYFAGQVPDTHPRWRDERRKREVIERGSPDPMLDGLAARNKQYYEHFIGKAKTYMYKGRRVTKINPRGLGTDGPLTVAANIRGATELFADFIEDPGYVKELLAFITEATILRIKAWRRYLGQPEKQDDFGLADDSVQLLSKEMYREFVLPCHKRLREALCTAAVGGRIHLCGDSTRHFETIRDELGIRSFDTGFPIDHGKLRQELGPEIEILGGPHVELLRSAPPQEVHAAARRILESGIKHGGRFVLREGNNLAPGTPLENIRALYQAAQDYGRYGSTLS